MIDPINLQFGGGIPPPPDHPGHPGHPFAGIHGIGQQGGPSPPAPSPGGLPQLGDGFADQQQVMKSTMTFFIKWTPARMGFLICTQQPLDTTR